MTRPYDRCFRRWRSGRGGRSLVIAAGLVVALLAAAAAAGAIQLSPYKDRLFAYPSVLEASPDGAYRLIDYRELRDINGRDVVPERRAKRAYVSLRPKRQSRLRTVETGGHRIDIAETGQLHGARFAVIFIHGRGGDRRLGADDWRFGGNFNRLKNLAVRNGGVYVAPSVASFDENGLAETVALISHIAAAAPQAPVVVACGSMGGAICWWLAHDRTMADRLAGLVILGGPHDPQFPASPAFAARVPLLLAHGTGDRVYDWRGQKAFFDGLKQHHRAYPVRLVLFASGSHGTPIRMIDWRETLNWMLGR